MTPRDFRIGRIHFRSATFEVGYVLFFDSPEPWRVGWTGMVCLIGNEWRNILFYFTPIYRTTECSQVVYNYCYFIFLCLNTQRMDSHIGGVVVFGAEELYNFVCDVRSSNKGSTI